MYIFYDLLNDRQEFFCDQSFKFTTECDFVYKLEAKVIDKPTDDLSKVNTGSNPSAEDEAEQLDEAAGGEKVVDVCFYHKLEEHEPLNNAKYLKRYMKAYYPVILKKLKEGNPEAVDEFKKAFKAGNEYILKVITDAAANDNLTCYVGENYSVPADVEGKDGKKTLDVQDGVVIGVWNDDGMSLSLYMLKHGLLEVKV